MENKTMENVNVNKGPPENSSDTADTHIKHCNIREKKREVRKET